MRRPKNSKKKRFQRNPSRTPELSHRSMKSSEMGTQIPSPLAGNVTARWPARLMVESNPIPEHSSLFQRMVSQMAQNLGLDEADILDTHTVVTGPSLTRQYFQAMVDRRLKNPSPWPLWVDPAQIERTVMGRRPSVPQMQSLRPSTDIVGMVASMMFGVAIQNVTGEMRYHARNARVDRLRSMYGQRAIDGSFLVVPPPDVMEDQDLVDWFKAWVSEPVLPWDRSLAEAKVQEVIDKSKHYRHSAEDFLLFAKYFIRQTDDPQEKAGG